MERSGVLAFHRGEWGDPPRGLCNTLEIAPPPPPPPPPLPKKNAKKVSVALIRLGDIYSVIPTDILVSVLGRILHV